MEDFRRNRWHQPEPGSALARLQERCRVAGGGEPRFTPELTRQACREFTEEYPWAEAGAAHVILSDYNLETHWFGACIRECLAAMDTGDDHDDRDVIDFLACLLWLDEDERVDEGEG